MAVTLSSTSSSDQASGLPRAPAAYIRWLMDRRGDLIREWIDRVAASSRFYRERPTDELEWTISESFAANIEALSTGRTAPLDRFVSFITSFRLKAGFPLSEVQKAFDTFRLILTPRLVDPPAESYAADAMVAVNACVSYQIQYFSQLFQDIHEREIRSRAERLAVQVEKRTSELDASESRYRTLVEEINDGYFMLRDERIVFANRTFCRMHQSVIEETIGRPFWSFVAPEDRDKMRRVYSESTAGHRTPRRIVFTRLGADGVRGATEIKARLVKLNDGLATIGICRDITERVVMERKLREHERMAYVGQLTASLSHEIRNPLSAIKMNMQILSRRVPLEGFDRRRLEIMVDQVTRLEDSLRRLLDTAKPLAPEPSFVDLNEIVRAAADLLIPKLSEKRVRLNRRLDRQLPRVKVDEAMVEQALMNLLLNALDASPEGGRITVSTRVAGNGFELSVKDDGPGLSDEELALLFTPFYSGKSHGTGLGLTNVKRIVEAHGGEVDVLTRPGGGAVFVMRVPGTE